ncbi:MAG: cyclic nucleotide-binding domain-containing protein [Nitrospiraceae bacterium]
MALFAGMTVEQATRLASACVVREYTAGDQLFAEGDPSDRLLVVLHGTVAISSSASTAPIGTVHAGEPCGEVSLLSAQLRSATATAEDAVETAEWQRADLMELIRRRPDIGVIVYRNLAVGLGEKLRRATPARV